MKNNIFGYIFFIFIIIIMGFAIYRVNTNNKIEQNNNTIKTSGTSNTQKSTDITLAISGFDTINPIITKNKNVQDITKLIYEPLVNVNDVGKAEACLAKEWETTDNLTYIVKLRSSVKWSDGTYFTSSDVKYTIDKLLQSEKNSIYTDSVKSIKEVDIIDNSTLKIILTEKVPFYEYFLTFPILSSKYYGEDNFWDTKKNDAPITTGRYIISANNSNTILLKKNPNWWNKDNEKSPIIENITINIYSKVAELYNAFKLGGIDFIATTNNDYKDYIGKIGYNVNEIEGRQFSFLALNTESNLLEDINLRKAIKYAINKDEICSNVYNGAYSRANFPLLTTSYFVEDKNESSFNLGEMENALQEAGWYLKNKEWQKVENKKIKKIELKMVVRQNSNRVKVADYIRDSLAEQGIGIYVEKVSDSEYENYIKNKNYDILLAEMSNSIAPNLISFFANGNMANFDNDEAKEIINVLGNITNEEELKNKMKKLYDIYEEEVPYIGIGRSKIYVITNSYLNGEFNSRWYNLYFNFNEWYKS